MCLFIVCIGLVTLLQVTKAFYLPPSTTHNLRSSLVRTNYSRSSTHDLPLTIYGHSLRSRSTVRSIALTVLIYVDGLRSRLALHDWRSRSMVTVCAQDLRSRSMVKAKGLHSRSTVTVCAHDLRSRSSLTIYVDGLRSRFALHDWHPRSTLRVCAHDLCALKIYAHDLRSRSAVTTCAHGLRS